MSGYEHFFILEPVRTVANCSNILYWMGFYTDTSENSHSFSPIFFTVFEYSPIGVKFPPITVPHTLYTVKKKNWKIFKTF
jgi:hypothetical protein